MTGVPALPVLLADKLERVPKSSDPHILADYIELLCLTNIDGEISMEDIIHRSSLGEDLGEGDPEDLRLDNTPEDNDSAMMTGVMHDRFREKVGAWFEHLNFRVNEFDMLYPFTINADEQTLLLQSPISDQAKLYLALLLASSLQYVDDRFQGALADSFELIGLASLRQYLPDTAEVYAFGSGNSHIGNTRFSSLHIFEKISDLAIGLRDICIAKREHFKPRDSGDGGLDVVAWIPFSDDSRGMLTVFGQSTCQFGWIKKSHSSGFTAWSNRIHFWAHPNNFSFIPYCWRDSSGKWYQESKLPQVVLMDRLRICQLLNPKAGELLTDLPSSSVISDVLNQVPTL